MALLVVTALVVWQCLVFPASHAATTLDTLRYSPDITVVLAGVTVNDEDAAEDNLAGTVTSVNLGTLPAGTDVDAYHLLPNGDKLLSFDTTVGLPGGLTAGPADVVRFDGTTFSLEFDAFANGLPGGANTDAVSIVGGGDLLLSFDTTTLLNGLTADDEDLVSFDGATFSLFFDGSTADVAVNLDLNAVHYLDGNGHLLVSFDGSGTVGGVAFNDDDVLELDPGSGTWELAYGGTAHHASWSAADLDALHATAAVNDQDGDGIVDFVDGEFVGGVFDDQSSVFSDHFTDQHLGGTSFGFMVDRDGLLVTVQDQPDPGGLLLGASGGGGTATVSACGFLLQLTDGDSIIITCSSMKAQVLAGPLEILLVEGIHVDVPTGATVTVTEHTEGEFSVENSPESTKPIIVTSGDQQIEILPGESVVVNATLPMSEFEIDRAKIDFKKKVDDDKARIRGRLDLDLFNGDAVEISEGITVTVGPLSENITMVEKGKKGKRWVYKRPKGGEGNIKHMIINWKNGKFDIRVDKADLAGMTNPVTISIKIGNDLGEETIQMKEKKHHWDYKAPK